MSASALIVIELSFVLTTIEFFADLSTISIVSSPSLSFSRTMCPLRDLIRRTLFLPSAFVSGGSLFAFQSAPITYG